MEMLHWIFFYAVLLLNVFGNCQLYGGSKNSIRSMCPQIYNKIFHGYVPRGNLSAGIFTEISKTTSLKQCVIKCCISSECNVAFTDSDRCYHVDCDTSELCAPTRSFNINATNHVAMVLVRPVLREDSWANVVEQDFQIEEETADNEIYNNMLNDRLRFENAYNNILDNIGEPTFEYTAACSVGIDETCLHHEECVEDFPRSRAGTCRCKTGHIRTENGCVLDYDFKEKHLEGITESVEFSKNVVPVEKKILVVTVQLTELKLSNNEVTIKAFVNPLPSEGITYRYDWSSLNQPNASAAVKHQSENEMRLSKLSEGLYTFKVGVSSDDAYGEAVVNVIVFPLSRINKPPQVVITPANQMIRLPSTGTVLDASSSTDDDEIVSFHWELQRGPLGYEPQLEDTPTLRLNDLTLPGNYTFKLTVTDSDNVTDSSTANITVLKEIDYPPEANAGYDVIIRLPQDEITLNGTASADDHGIITWEWTKSESDVTKPVDMQNTRTPILKLSGLEEGIYTFILKVTDIANQSDSAIVHVFVKPPIAENITCYNC